MSPVETGLTDYPARYFDCWNRRDIEFAVDAFAEQLTWTDPLLPAPLTTRAAAREFFTFGWAAFPDLHFESVGVPLVDAANGRVAQQWVMSGSDSGTGFRPGIEPTGARFEIHGADVWAVGTDGRASSVQAFWDAASLARQLDHS